MRILVAVKRVVDYNVKVHLLTKLPSNKPSA